MRPSCLNCVRKHLSQAIVLLQESYLGYPDHKWLAVGHLAEAESESLLDYPELSIAIRAERLKVMDDTDIPDIMPLIGFATKLADGSTG